MLQVVKGAISELRVLGAAPRAFDEIRAAQEYVAIARIRAPISIREEGGVAILGGHDFHISRGSAQFAWQVLDTFRLLVVRKQF